MLRQPQPHPVSMLVPWKWSTGPAATAQMQQAYKDARHDPPLVVEADIFTLPMSLAPHGALPPVCWGASDSLAMARTQDHSWH